VVVSVSALSQLAIALLLADRGISQGDEAYYLNSMRYWDAYDAMTSRFGALLSPVYIFTGGDIATLRRVAIVAVYASSFFLTVLVVSTIEATRVGSEGGVRRIPRLVLLALGLTGMAVSALVFYRVLLTPNYNILGLLTIQWALAGVLLVVGDTRSPRSARRVFGLVLTGVSLALCAFNKPTTALLVAPLLLVIMAVLRALTLRRFLLTLGSSMTTSVLLAQAISGGVPELIEGTRAFLYAQSISGSGHSLSALITQALDPWFSPQDITVKPLGFATVSLIVLAWVVPRWAGYFTAALVCLATFLFWRSTMSHGNPVVLVDGSAPNQWVVISAPLGALVLLVLLQFTNPRLPIDGRVVVGGVAVALLPFAWAFGSNNNPIQWAGTAGFFWFLAAIWLLLPLDPRVSLVAAGATQALTLLVLAGWYTTPYGQAESVARQSTDVEFGPTNSHLKVSGDYGEYLSALADARDRGIPPPGTPIIDLTNDSPLASYALGAVNLGIGWHNGNYPNGEAAIASLLSRESCTDLAAAWLLSTEGGGYDMDPSVLTPTGRSFPADYEVVERFPKFGDSLVLWRPQESATSTCVDAS
jgi:hypothetical protein